MATTIESPRASNVTGTRCGRPRSSTVASLATRAAARRARASSSDMVTAWRPRASSDRRRGAEIPAPEVQRHRPRLAGRLVRLARRVELGPGEEAVADARVDPVAELDAVLGQATGQLGHVVHADAGVLVAPEAEDGPAHPVRQVERRGRPRGAGLTGGGAAVAGRRPAPPQRGAGEREPGAHAEPHRGTAAAVP